MEESASTAAVKMESETYSDSRPTQAQRAYLAHTAPHLFDHPLSALSPSPDAAASGAGLPSSAASPSGSLSASSSRSPSPSTTTTAKKRTAALKATTKHTVPPNFRGPIPRDTDAEEVAPRPALHTIPGSQTQYQTHSTPFNRNSWRYTWAGPSTDTLPFSVYKSIPVQPSGIHWDWSDRSVFTSISKDASVVSAEKGWRSVRANLPIREGSWYCEVEILPPEHSTSSGKDGNHVRLGFGRREAGLNAPVGFDAYSYGLRDTTCQRVFLSRPSEFTPQLHSLRPGDVVGMLITIPALSKPNPSDTKDPRHIRRKRIPIRYRGQLYFEQLEYPMSKEMDHLMKRSWKGEQLLREDGTLKLLRDGKNGVDPDSIAPSLQEQQEESRRKAKKKFDVAPSNPTAPPNLQHSTERSTTSSGPGPGSKQKGVTKKKRDKDTTLREDTKDSPLRSLPTLGPDSGIAFYLNGQSLGWAFRDLLDFRPLRPAPDPKPSKTSTTSSEGKKKKKQKTSSPDLDPSLLTSALDMDELSTLTTSASSSAILKSRENGYDDGTCGYFPMVSLYGGSRVRLRTRVNEFTALPPDISIQDDIISLEGKEVKPLSSLSEEYWTTQARIDVQEEERSKLRHEYLVAKFGPNYGRDEDTEDEDEQEVGGGGEVGGEGLGEVVKEEEGAQSPQLEDHNDVQDARYEEEVQEEAHDQVEGHISDIPDAEAHGENQDIKMEMEVDPHRKLDADAEADANLDVDANLDAEAEAEVEGRTPPMEM